MRSRRFRVESFNILIANRKRKVIKLFRRREVSRHRNEPLYGARSDVGQKISNPEPASDWGVLLFAAFGEPLKLLLFCATPIER